VQVLKVKIPLESSKDCLNYNSGLGDQPAATKESKEKNDRI
jgi:hypothetical protein